MQWRPWNRRSPAVRTAGGNEVTTLERLEAVIAHAKEMGAPPDAHVAYPSPRTVMLEWREPEGGE